MTGSVDRDLPRILALGLGNQLLTDDGAGLRLLSRLEQSGDFDGAVEFVDGGTQGLALLPYLAGRDAILVLDAMRLGAPAGSVHVVQGTQVRQFRARRASTAHESSAIELLETARLLGYECEDVAVVGVEPMTIRTGIGLTPEVERALPNASRQALKILEGMVAHVPCNTR